ncbi:putative vacuolar protein sorting-associated protein tda6 [Acrodontium crateriforme]|uniref:Vacuolar protein sorting-associated protein tda6 n=1 Tax=Acrodontium crateriforme TaxID=150365 RepID=A0AAQ3M416_9PEZI|nr:putative vacuolar protein sorting-associated protein tda6 [Acrodontium crateriforme]
MQTLAYRCLAAFLAISLAYLILSGIGAHATQGTNPIKISENKEWIATSKYWLDRQFCIWFGLCGTLHLREAGWTWKHDMKSTPSPIEDVSGFWFSGREDPDSWSDEEIKKRTIPDYVFEHAPYVHLFSGEQFWPCDLPEHLLHTSPYLNYSAIPDADYKHNLSNLHELNDVESGMHARYVYLQSNDNVEERPTWLAGDKNIPNSPRVENNYEIHGVGPNSEDLKALHNTNNEQQNVDQSDQDVHVADANFIWPIERTPSLNGRCGGNSGYTCKGSQFGQCCSIHGWCGGSELFCDDLCDPLAGDCKDLLALGPRPDLRRRKRRLDKLEKTQHDPNRAGRSSAPAILVVVDKGNGTVDAFWFFFYSYNLGQTVFNIRFGNHVGDWEHTLVRFKDGQPHEVFLSEHTFGEAYSWSAMEKYLPNPDGSGTMLGTFSNITAARAAKRPVVFSAVGSHAMYGTPGLHPYILPWGLLHDQTDRGPLWDPSLNVRSFTYNSTNQEIRSSTRNPKAPVGWFNYAGHWGDKYYPLSDPRQYRFAGQYHYVNGPSGPKFKNLGRRTVCQNSQSGCEVRKWLGGSRSRMLPFPDDGDEEEGGIPGGNSTDDKTLT